MKNYMWRAQPRAWLIGKSVVYHIVIVTRGYFQTEKKKKERKTNITQKFGVIQIALYETIGNPYYDKIIQSLKSPLL